MLSLKRTKSDSTPSPRPDTVGSPRKRGSHADKKAHRRSQSDSKDTNMLQSLDISGLERPRSHRRRKRLTGRDRPHSHCVSRGPDSFKAFESIEQDQATGSKGESVFGSHTLNLRKLSLPPSRSDTQFKKKTSRSNPSSAREGSSRTVLGPAETAEVLKNANRLPPGWSREIHKYKGINIPYFVDHNTRSTRWTPPPDDGGNLLNTIEIEQCKHYGDPPEYPSEDSKCLIAGWEAKTDEKGSVPLYAFCGPTYSYLRM